MKAALIGVGAMGSALLRRMLDNNHEIQVFDIDEARAAAAEQAGAIRTRSPMDAARDARRIHVFVNTDEQVRESVLGPAGVLAGASSHATLFLHPTILPETTLVVAAEARHATVIDAPITSTPRRILEGKGIALVGGEVEAIREATPYLQSLGLDVRHFGPLGAGNVAKLAKNFANVGERLALITAVELAQTAGLNPKQFLEMLSDSTDKSAIERWDHVFSIKEFRAVVRPVTNLFQKDVGLAVRLAEVLQVDTPYLHGAEETSLQIVKRWT